MSDAAAIRIRPSQPTDGEWILPLAPRLHDFGPPPWRERPVMDRAVTESIERGLRTPPPGSAVLVAERADGAPLGFVHLETAHDFFTHEPHGHVSDLVVAPIGEGQGVGTALMRAAEAWGRAQGYRLMTLNVFDDNRRARALYERLGYRPDTLKFIRELDAPA